VPRLKTPQDRLTNPRAFAMIGAGCGYYRKQPEEPIR
jgi:hypothetical protein